MEWQVLVGIVLEMCSLVCFLWADRRHELRVVVQRTVLVAHPWHSIPYVKVKTSGHNRRGVQSPESPKVLCGVLIGSK
jgi:hypothetical protein